LRRNSRNPDSSSSLSACVMPFSFSPQLLCSSQL
jgi:hypothetical protein